MTTLDWLVLEGALFLLPTVLAAGPTPCGRRSPSPLPGGQDSGEAS